MKRLNTIKSLWIFFVLLRIPYLLLEFPGCIYPDTAGSIEQFFGYPDFTAQLSSSDPSTILTNHNPVIYTLLYGGTIWAGNLIGSQSIAVFTLITLQMLLHSWILARLFILLRPTNKNRKVLAWWNVSILFTALFPIYGFWSTLMLKDALFSITTLWLTLYLLEAVQSNGQLLNDKIFLLRFISVCFLFMLSKNQCFYIVILLIAATSLFYRKWRLSATLSISALLYFLWLHILLPACHVALSGRQELYGFAFQQTALYIKQYSTEVEPEEREAISALLPYDSIAALYNPDLQDPVKFRYRVNASDDDFARFRWAYIRLMKRHPMVAIQSVWAGCNDYFIPNGRFPLFSPSFAINEPPCENFYTMDTLLHPQPSGMNTAMHIPLIGLLFRMGFYIPLSLVGYLILLIRRKWEASLALFPVFVSIGVLIISPQNGCFRYVMPIIWALPIELLLIISTPIHKTATQA